MESSHCAEIDTPEKLATVLRDARPVLEHNTVVQGMDLRPFEHRFAPPDPVGVEGVLFIGCRFGDPAVVGHLTLAGAVVIPEMPDLPFQTHPYQLYSPDDLLDGYDAGGFDGMFDTVVYRSFLDVGGGNPKITASIAQRLHDTGIDDALEDALEEWRIVTGGAPVVGVMGGHAVHRGSVAYRQAATLGREVARAGCMVVTGGGPGVMEAANLGAYFADAAEADLDAAIALLAQARDFADAVPYTAAAVSVRERWPRSAAIAAPEWARTGGLAIPTWYYGHEPANLFAGRVAKYFSNALREDKILEVSRGGLVFAAGRAGTVQEVFQAATKVFYGPPELAPPLVFLGSSYWDEALPAAPALLRQLLAGARRGALDHLVYVMDDTDEIVRTVTKSIVDKPEKVSRPFRIPRAGRIVPHRKNNS